MSHTIVGKLNKAARKQQASSGYMFFIDVGEKNYNYKTKESQWTNYSAAIFCKETQLSFYENALNTGAVVEIIGTGLIIDMPDDPKYKPRLEIQNASLGYVWGTAVSAPESVKEAVGQPPIESFDDVDPIPF